MFLRLSCWFITVAMNLSVLMYIYLKNTLLYKRTQKNLLLGSKRILQIQLLVRTGTSCVPSCEYITHVWMSLKSVLIVTTNLVMKRALNNKYGTQDQNCSTSTIVTATHLLRVTTSQFCTWRVQLFRIIIFQLWRNQYFERQCYVLTVFSRRCLFIRILRVWRFAYAW